MSPFLQPLQPLCFFSRNIIQVLEQSWNNFTCIFFIPLGTLVVKSWRAFYILCYLDVSCSIGYRGYCIKFQSMSSLYSHRLLEELGSHSPGSCFHGNNLDYRFLASQAKSPCLFSFKHSALNYLVFCLWFLQFIHNTEGCVCVFSRFYQRFREEWKVFTSPNGNNEYTLQPPTTLLVLFPSILPLLYWFTSPSLQPHSSHYSMGGLAVFVAGFSSLLPSVTQCPSIYSFSLLWN